jgi:16S rRNA processing protein RimM
VNPPHPRDAWIWLARIRRPQGRKGEVFAEILTDFPEKFSQRRRLWLLDPSRKPAIDTVAAIASSEPREVTLLHHWLHKGGIVLHFSGVDSISSAEALAGLVVAIPASDRAQLPPGEFHIADLIGCTLVDLSFSPPREIGVIENVDRTAGPVPLLLVRGAAPEILIPFAEPFLRSVDLQHRRVEMSLPEGLVDLNTL